MVRPRFLKLAVVVGLEDKMTPIVFEVTKSKVKVTVTLSCKIISDQLIPNGLALNLQTCFGG